MNADNLKLVFTYALAFVIVVGGGIMLFVTRLDPPETGSQNLALVLAGFIGAAIQYVFNKETATQATRAAESSMRAAQPSVTTTGVGPGGTVTVESDR